MAFSFHVYHAFTFEYMYVTCVPDMFIKGVFAFPLYRPAPQNLCRCWDHLFPSCSWIWLKTDSYCGHVFQILAAVACHLSNKGKCQMPLHIRYLMLSNNYSCQHCQFQKHKANICCQIVVLNYRIFGTILNYWQVFNIHISNGELVWRTPSHFSQ